MKIHRFIQDAQLMKKNEKEAIIQRERYAKRQQKIVEDTEFSRTTEEKQKTRKKKKKEGDKENE